MSSDRIGPAAYAHRLLNHHRHETGQILTEGWGRGPVCAARVQLRGGWSCWMLQIGALGISWGPADGIGEGRAGIPDDWVRWEWERYYADHAGLVSVTWTTDGRHVSNAR